MNKRILICISGGSGSGKTTVGKMLVDYANKQGKKAFLISQDSFYNSNWGKTMDEKRKMNYDHPHSFDWDLILATMQKAIDGEKVIIPEYDYSISERSKTSQNSMPDDVDVIIFEGIYALNSKELLQHSELSMFIDVDDDIRFIRRLRRDMLARGRNMDSVITQWTSSVKPMYDSFIVQQRRRADVIIPWHKKTNMPVKIFHSLLSHLK